jgi:hypothetical protein
MWNRRRQLSFDQGLRDIGWPRVRFDLAVRRRGGVAGDDK